MPYQIGKDAWDDDEQSTPGPEARQLLSTQSVHQHLAAGNVLATPYKGASQQPSSAFEVIDLTTSDDESDDNARDEVNNEHANSQAANYHRHHALGDDEVQNSRKPQKGFNGEESPVSGISPLPKIAANHWDTLLAVRNSPSTTRDTKPAGQVDQRRLKDQDLGESGRSGQTLRASAVEWSSSEDRLRARSRLSPHSRVEKARRQAAKKKVGRPPLTETEKARRKAIADASRRPRGRPPSKNVGKSRSLAVTGQLGTSSPAPGITVQSSVVRPVQTEQPKPTPTPVNLSRSRAWMHRHSSSPFIQQLYQISRIAPEITIINDVDEDGPPAEFDFVGEYLFRPGTSRIDPEARIGCTCRKDNGRNIGCEYRSCQCIEDAAEENGKPMGFAYHGVNETKGCLRNMYLEQRFVIYECNELCNCPPHCKNKVVQKGRQIPLEIFKTTNRGWGLRSPVPIRKGQFVDVYLGEVLTDAEARRREKGTNNKKDSYLFALDKFHELDMESSQSSEDPGQSLATPPPNPNLFVVDGEHYGGPTRFINHSCSPNLRQFAVSLVRGDPRVYELAFFATNDIEAGEELTFDYLDKDDEDDENVLTTNNENEGRPRCQCGSERCRGWLWG